MGPSETLVTCEQNSKRCNLSMTLLDGDVSFQADRGGGDHEGAAGRRPEKVHWDSHLGALGREASRGQDLLQCRGGGPQARLPTSVSSEGGLRPAGPSIEPGTSQRLISEIPLSNPQIPSQY